MPNTDTDWTAARIAVLRELWAEGHSTAEIGRRMKLSKNSVIGKAHRIGLGRPSPIRAAGTGGRPNQVKAGRAPRTALAALPSLVVLPAALVTPVAAPGPETRPVPRRPMLPPVAPVEARDRGPCCWPIGEPGTRAFRYCDAPVMAAGSYCAAHRAVAYRPRRPAAIGVGQGAVR